MMKKSLLLAAVGLAWLGSASGQSTLGEILDKGAKKLFRPEFVALLPASVSGVWLDGNGEASVVYEADGTFSGMARHYGSNTTSGSFGTWNMNETGIVCIVEQLPGWRTSHKECQFRFLLGDDLYYSPSDSDRNAKALLRAKGIGKKQ
jgi:hypothetical protein